jgi:hypothetical protein
MNGTKNITTAQMMFRIPAIPNAASIKTPFKVFVVLPEQASIPGVGTIFSIAY